MFHPRQPWKILLRSRKRPDIPRLRLHRTERKTANFSALLPVAITASAVWSLTHRSVNSWLRLKSLLLLRREQVLKKQTILSGITSLILFRLLTANSIFAILFSEKTMIPIKWILTSCLTSIKDMLLAQVSIQETTPKEFPRLSKPARMCFALTPRRAFPTGKNSRLPGYASATAKA